MATLTPAGAGSSVTPATTAQVNTSVNIPGGNEVFAAIAWGGATINLNSFTGGGLTWSVIRSARSGGLNFAICKATAASQVNSGTQMQATFSGTGSTGSNYVAISYGPATAGAELSGATSSGTANMTWATTGLAQLVGDTEYGGMYEADGFSTTSNTPTSPSVELSDTQIATDSMMATEYRDGSAGTNALAGTLTSDVTNIPWVGAVANWGTRGLDAIPIREHDLSVGPF